MSKARTCIRREERILFARRLSLYLNSGIPISRALNMLRESAVRPALVRFYDSLCEHISHGRTLTTALADYRTSFGESSINLITVGESSGSLARNLAQVAEIEKRRGILAQKILSALIYPSILLLGTIGITLFLVLYAFPKIVPLFNGFHATLPFPTRVLLHLSALPHTHPIPLILIPTIAIGCLVVMLRSPRMRSQLLTYSLRMPIIGRTLSLYYAAGLARTLEILLDSGMHIEKSLMVARSGISHPAYTLALAEVTDAVAHGHPLSISLQKFPALFPSLLTQFITAGEMSGSLPQSLGHAALMFEEDIAERVARFSTLIEPVLMIFMGGTVGFIALAITTPIYGLTQSMSAH